MYDPLYQARGMGPPKWDTQESIGVTWCANANASNIGGGEPYTPEAVGEVQGGDGGRAGGAATRPEQCRNFEQGRETKLGWQARAIGIERAHVDNQCKLGWGLSFDKSFSIGETRVDGHQTCRQEGIKHLLEDGAIGWFVRRCAGVCEEEATWGC